MTQWQLSIVLLQHPDPKDMQINLTGFLNGKNARVFIGALWGHLLSAQENDMGVPEAFLEAKKAELLAKKVRAYTYTYVLRSDIT